MKRYSYDDIANIKWFFGNNFNEDVVTDEGMEELVQLYDAGDFTQMQAKMESFNTPPVYEENRFVVVPDGHKVVPLVSKTRFSDFYGSVERETEKIFKWNEVEKVLRTAPEIVARQKAFDKKVEDTLYTNPHPARYLYRNHEALPVGPTMKRAEFKGFKECDPVSELERLRLKQIELEVNPMMIIKREDEDGG